jgi:NAD(P)-dependent dehydrogenase (short-subunit alcohol dehydrogenase family)
VVVITGAASGIGAACAARLRRRGHTVIGVDQHRAEVVADLGTVSGRSQAVAGVRALCGGSLAGVVTCAGLAGAPSREGSTVQPAIPPDLVAAFLDHDEGLSRDLADEAGSMVTYPASKIALAYWVRAEATGPNWAGAGRRLNAIAPGMIETPMVADMRSDAEVGPLLDMLPIPVGRTGRAEEIAALVELLLGPDGGFFCGSVLFCDGGSDALLRTRDWPAAWDIPLPELGKKLSS